MRPKEDAGAPMQYAVGLFFVGDENTMEGPEYLYNTAPFWAALAVLSCGAGAVMFTDPLWDGAVSSTYSNAQWTRLATASAVSQALVLLPGALIDAADARGARRAATARARVACGAGALTTLAYAAATALLAAASDDMQSGDGAFARMLTYTALAGLGAAGLTMAALQARDRADRARARDAARERAFFSPSARERGVPPSRALSLSL